VLNNRYGSKKLENYKSLTKKLIIFLTLSLIGLSVVYVVAPRPFREIVYHKFLYRKLILPLYQTSMVQDGQSSRSRLKRYDISLETKVQEEMNLDILGKGKQWQDVLISSNNQENIPAKIKLRGHSMSFYHWGGVKKSLWVKTKAGTYLDKWKRASFTNFKEPIYSVDALAYNMAQEIGILSPRHEFINLYTNKKYQGVFHLIEYFDKYYLQNNLRIQGDIYALDEYKDLENAFLNEKYWVKKSFNRKAEKTSKSNLIALLNCLKNNCSNIEDFIDIDKYLKHTILFELFGSDHADNFHNQRMYFDPSVGKFEPIVWDIIMFKRDAEFNQSTNWINQSLLLSPKLRQRKLEIQREIFKETITEEFITNYIDNFLDLVGSNIKNDKYLGAQWSFTYEDWKKALFEIKDGVLHRRELMLRNSEEVLKGKLYGYKEKYNLVLSTAHNYVIKKIVLERPQRYIQMNSGHEKLQIELDDNGLLKDEILVSSRWTPLNGKVKHFLGMVPTTKVLKNEAVVEFDGTGIKEIHLFNPVTLQVSKISLSPEKKERIQPNSMIQKYSRPKLEVISFKKGHHKIIKNRFYDKNTKLIFEAGAKISLAPKVSLHTRGKVLIKGSSDQPVIFMPLEKGKPWGTFSIQGPQANGSQIEFAEFHSGSNATLENVFYSGMLNCYHADCFISHSYFTDSHGDDAVNYKSAKGDIKESLFYKTGFDAIDIDFSFGLVENNIIFKSGNDGIDLGTGHSKIYSNIIWESGDKGISMGERSYPLIFNNLILKNNIGIAVKDLSKGLIHHNLLEENKVAITAYQKKSAFGGGSPLVVSNIINKSKREDSRIIEKDVQSNIEMYNNLIDKFTDRDKALFKKISDDQLISFIEKSSIYFKEDSEVIKDLEKEKMDRLSRYNEFIKLKSENP
jgi:small nuclear ribonucleoprotein (snRNP)-like protein